MGQFERPTVKCGATSFALQHGKEEKVALQDFAGYPPDLGVMVALSFRVKKPPFVSFGDKLARKQLETASFRLFS